MVSCAAVHSLLFAVLPAAFVFLPWPVGPARVSVKDWALPVTLCHVGLQLGVCPFHGDRARFPPGWAVASARPCAPPHSVRSWPRGPLAPMPPRLAPRPLTAAGASSTAAWPAASGRPFSASRLSWGCWGCFARSWRTPSARPRSLTARSGPCPGCHSPLLSPVGIGRAGVGTCPAPGSPQTQRGGRAHLPGHLFGEIAVGQELELAPVLCLVVHNLNVPCLDREGCSVAAACPGQRPSLGHPLTWSIQSLPTMMLCTVEVLFLHT